MKSYNRIDTKYALTDARVVVQLNRIIELILNIQTGARVVVQ